MNKYILVINKDTKDASVCVIAKDDDNEGDGDVYRYVGTLEECRIAKSFLSRMYPDENYTICSFTSVE